MKTHSLVTQAFVLKNYIPEKYKVVILHKQLGKITCVYKGNKNKAARLCTGSLIVCTIEQQKSWYEIVDVDIMFIPLTSSVTELTFFHHIVLLCLKLLPGGIAVGELFDYLLYVYNNIAQLSDQGRDVVLLRLFLLFDMLPEHKQMYRCAIQDPYNIENLSEQQTTEFIAICWRRFYQEVQTFS
ncbi:MAG: hypothetical protein CL947_01790 [Epsilonproteobacteria bacterium]|nr:hypothetical protein [Campylobacterota bacterium]|tara:strand:- start:3911 stop:4462 length:552 start_codon:yes stop_codon:yes gene_type:complete